MKMKKAIGVFLSMAVLSGAASVSAQEPPNVFPISGEPVIISEDGEIQPFSTCFKYAYASLTPDGSKATCTATVSTREGYTYSYAMSLIRSTDKTVDVDDWEEVKLWTGSGEAGVTAKAHSETMKRGYYYAVRLVLTGLTGNNPVETYTIYSGIKDYTA